MDPEIIEVQVDEVVTPNGKSTQKKPRSSEQEQWQMPKMGLRARITMKVMQLMANPKTARFFKKGWWPLWLLVGILIFSLAIVAGAIFMVWRLLLLITRPYIELFTKNKKST